MMLARVLNGNDADTEIKNHKRQAKTTVLPAAPSHSSVTETTTETDASRPPLPRVSPISYTSHAMMLQMQEYRTRVHNAFQSTYRHPLVVNTRPATTATGKREAHTKGYCRKRILESSRGLFAAETRNATPSVSTTPSSPARSSIKGGGVAFHRSTTAPRTATAQSSLYGLGPGQYNATPRRPATTGSVKFSPADRFREHSAGNSDPHALGPGHYSPDHHAIAKRSVRVGFSQLPRRTETVEPPRSSATSSTPSATAGVVSSYYFVPASGFTAPGDNTSLTGGGIPNWGHSPRFPGRQEHFQRKSSQVSPAVDYITRNIAKIENISIQQRRRRRMQQAAMKREEKIKQSEMESPTSPSVRRRTSIFYTDLHAQNLAQTGTLHQHRGSCVPVEDKAKNTAESVTIPQAWSTLIMISVTQTKLERLLVVATVLRRLRLAQEIRHKQVTFEAWTHVRDRDAMRSLAAVFIARSTFRYRLNLRVQRKICAAKLLRRFLAGLSFDVRFAMHVRRVKRRIIQLQRWWRHSRLVVRAREHCLAHKWLIIEQKLRADHIAQMPHLHKIFQPPSTTYQLLPSADVRRSSVVGRNSIIGSSMKGRKSVVGGANAAVDVQIPLHKLVSLPEQRRWFTARFVLTSDGVLRGFAVPSVNQRNDMVDNVSGERLVVEVKHFRCHAHGFLNVALSSTYAAISADDDGERYWRPYLMVFRPGASRFVLITDAKSLVPAPLFDWKDKLERVAGHSVGSPIPGGGSLREITEMLTQSDASALDDTLEETADTPNRDVSGIGIGQERRRSSRPRLRRSQAAQPVAEGELSYYVVDLLRDCPRIPPPMVWTALRDKLREERRNFRSDIYRYKLETDRYKQHQQERRQLLVLDKFKEFFMMERPCRPHFRSLISHRKMEALVSQTIELVKATQPSNPSLLLSDDKKKCLPTEARTAS